MAYKPNYIRKKEHRFFIFLISLIILFIESYALFLLYSNKLAPHNFFIIHIIASFICLSIYFIYKVLDYDLRYPIMNLAFVFFLGPFGAFLFMATTLLSSFYLRRVEPLEKTIGEFFPQDPEDENAFRVYERIRFGLDVYDPDKIPYSYEEVMRYGTEAQKKTAIERILKYFRKEFTKPLLQALSDKASSVRILAATAVARIDNQYSEHLKKIEEEVLQNPNDADLQFKYANLLESLSELDLIDTDRREKLREKAIVIFEELEKEYPENKDISFSLGKLYLNSNQLQKAIFYLYNLKDKHGFVDDEALKELFKALFKNKQYQKIREIIKENNIKVKGEAATHDILIDEIMLWKNGIPKEKLYLRRP